MNKRLFPLVQAAMIAAALIGGNAASIVSAEDAPVIPQETALTETAEPAATETVTTEPESAPDEPAETPEEPDAPAEPEIVEFAAEPEEAALEALMSAPESEPIEPEIVQAAAETLSAMPTARKAAALKAMRPVTYVPEGLPEGVTLSVDVPPAAFSEPVEIYARFLTDPEDGSFSEDIIAAAQAQYEEALAACEEGYSVGLELFDITFKNEAGEEVEPALPVSVSLAFPQADEALEITGVRHFTDAANVEVYEDLDFTADNSDELTLNYITESCSQFTVTWTNPSPDKVLTIVYVNDQGQIIDVNNVPSSVTMSDDGIYHISHNTITATDGKRYKFYNTATVSTPNSNQFLDDCNYIQYFTPNSWFGVLFLGTVGWWYSQNDNAPRDCLGWGSGDGKRFPGSYEYEQDSKTIYLVYYEDPYPTNFHYGIRATTDINDYSILGSKEVNISNGTPVNLAQDEYAQKNLGQLHIYRETASGLVELTGNALTIKNEYKNHPADNYYFIYYDPNYIPAPTGVTQKAAPYAAMVILAAVTAAVMIKRRKGGDVDETSPL